MVEKWIIIDNASSNHKSSDVPLRIYSLTLSTNLVVGVLFVYYMKGYLFVLYKPLCCHVISLAQSNNIDSIFNRYVIFWPTPRPKMLFQGVTPEGSDTFQWPVIERDHVGGLRLMIWDKVKVPLYHYSDAPEESNLWTAWQLFPLDDD